LEADNMLAKNACPTGIAFGPVHVKTGIILVMTSID